MSCKDSGSCATCTGMCCLDFVLTKRMVKGIQKNPEEWIDGEFVKDMLIPLDEPLHFTCKHHDPETLLCMAYDKRPDMCRQFPQGTDDCDCQ